MCCPQCGVVGLCRVGPGRERQWERQSEKVLGTVIEGDRYEARAPAQSRDPVVMVGDYGVVFAAVEEQEDRVEEEFIKACRRG